MAFTKETASKAGKKSSRKGKPNRTTEEVRDLFKDLLENNMTKFQKDLDKLEPEQRLKVLLEVAKFVIPTLKSSELKGGLDLSMNYQPIWGTIDPVLAASDKEKNEIKINNN